MFTGQDRNRDGVATAVNRLKDSKSKSKVIILLTDRVNNAGFIERGGRCAKQYGIKCIP
jgi:Ca-activated chloride channel family protein